MAPRQQILRDTGVFEHTWRELELWLEHLDSTAEERKEAVIQFLERVSASSMERCAPGAADWATPRLSQALRLESPLHVSL
jgi:hypothetical protein